MFAAEYPFLNILWTMIIFFAWVIWIWTVISILGDVFRRHDIGGGTKALWTFFIIFLPFLGVLIYLVSQGQGMSQRSAEQMKQTQKLYEQHIREVAGGGGAASEIANAKALLEAGYITQEEYEALKRKALT